MNLFYSFMIIKIFSINILFIYRYNRKHLSIIFGEKVEANLLVTELTVN